jgi:transposase
MMRRSFSIDFRRETASLVLDQGYTVPQACKAVGVGPTAVRRWVTQLHQERDGHTPKRSRALTPEQQRIQALEAQVQRLEREKKILKEATALLMSGSLDR